MTQKYLLQSLDQGAYTLIDPVTQICYILMVNAIMTEDTNVQVTIVRIANNVEDEKYPIAEHETFMFRVFVRTWDLVEELLHDMLEGIMLDDIDLEHPTLLGEVYGGWVNGEVAQMADIEHSEIN